MAVITRDMIECVYEMATYVYSGKVSKKDAAMSVFNKTGMKIGSANNYIGVFQSMMNGRCYNRTINATATDYYLKHIGVDYGTEAQLTAVRATLEHIEYYRSKKSNLPSIERVVEEYK